MAQAGSEAAAQTIQRRFAAAYAFFHIAEKVHVAPGQQGMHEVVLAAEIVVQHSGAYSRSGADCAHIQAAYSLEADFFFPGVKQGEVKLL